MNAPNTNMLQTAPEFTPVNQFAKRNISHPFYSEGPPQQAPKSLIFGPTLFLQPSIGSILSQVDSLPHVEYGGV